MRKVIIKIILIFVSALNVSGCITVPDRQVDVEAAVKNHVSAGLEYLNQQQPNNARRHFLKALSFNDKSAEAHNAMALLYRYEFDDVREESHYKKAIKADSDFAAARNNYGIFLVRQKRHEAALQQFSKAVDNQGNDNRALAYENMGRVLLVLERGNEAIDAFNRAARLSPDNPGPALELAALFFDKGELKTADFYYSNYARMVNPQPARALWLGIRISTELRQLDRSASYELALKKLHPDSAEFKAWKRWRGSSL